jgi:Zn-dependent protease with chaperone function
VVSSLVAVALSHQSLNRPPPQVQALLKNLADDARVKNAVATISARAHRPVPRAGIASELDGTKFQAEAIGRPVPGFVFITRPLLESLTDEELAAVLAHELAHVWYPMKGRHAILLVWGIVFGGFLEFCYALAMFGPHFRASEFLYSGWLLLILLVFAPLLSVLVPAAVSRHAEAKADDWACRLGCDGLCLATALWEMEAQAGQGRALSNEGKNAPRLLGQMKQLLLTKSTRRSWTARRRRETLLGLCRCDLVAEGLLARLLSGHPDTVRRTRRMLAESRGSVD